MSDLKPNKKLINNAFDGYKLASDELGLQSLPLVTPVNGVTCKHTQYSYAYIRSHEMHNHLYHDQFSNNIYFTDENMRVNVLQEGENHSSFHEVFNIPKQDVGLNGSAFCESLMFPSEELAVLSDGNGWIYLINTGSRNNKLQKWQVVTNSSIHNLQAPAVLLSTSIDSSLLHILAMSLREFKHENLTTTKVILHWLQVHISSIDPAECAVKGVRLFLGKSIPQAHWFTENFSHLVTAADNPFHLVDSESYEKIEPLIPLEKGEIVEKYYRWYQSKELVSITFDFHVTEKEVDVELKHNNIIVKLSNGKVLMAGELEQEITVDASRWFVEKNRLEVNLIKKTAGTFWMNVLKSGDTHGVHDILGEEEENICYVNDSLAHLSSDGTSKEEKDTTNFNMQQLEECDQTIDEDTKLFSVNVFTGKIDILKNFSGYQWLFTKASGQGEAPLICLRHDVDGIVWQPSRKLDEDWEHAATFDALGYVQASKEDHKFTTCNDDFKYAFITDYSAHVYIYEADNKNKKQHRQYIKGFSDCEKILGCQAVSNKFYVLTDTHINIIQLSSPASLH